MEICWTHLHLLSLPHPTAYVSLPNTLLHMLALHECTNTPSDIALHLERSLMLKPLNSKHGLPLRPRWASVSASIMLAVSPIHDVSKSRLERARPGLDFYLSGLPFPKVNLLHVQAICIWMLLDADNLTNLQIEDADIQFSISYHWRGFAGRLFLLVFGRFCLRRLSCLQPVIDASNISLGGSSGGSSGADPQGTCMHCKGRQAFT